MGARLHALGLPTRDTVALLPTSKLLVTGIEALWLGLLSGVAVAILVWVAGDRLTSRTWRWTLSVLLIAPVVVWVIVQPATWGLRIILMFAGFAAVAIAFRLILQFAGKAKLGYLLFVLALATGASLSLLTAYVPPTGVSRVDIRLADGNRASGLLIASTSDSVLLAPEVRDRPVGTLVSISRSKVLSMAVRSRSHAAASSTGKSGTPLAGGSAHAPQTAPATRVGWDQYLADLRNASEWFYPPEVSVDAVDYITNLPNGPDREAFFLHAPGVFHAGDDVTVDLGVLMGDPQNYTAHAIVTSGVISQAYAFDLEPRPTNGRAQVIVITDGRDETRETWCQVVLAPGVKPLRPAERAKLRGVVVAWGAFNARAGRQFAETVLACSAARRAP